LPQNGLVRRVFGKDELNATRMIARPVCPTSAFAALRFAIITISQGTEPEDRQKNLRHRKPSKIIRIHDLSFDH
jgi:hypothetical protein